VNATLEIKSTDCFKRQATLVVWPIYLPLVKERVAGDPGTWVLSAESWDRLNDEIIILYSKEARTQRSPEKQDELTTSTRETSAP
jgi:hypothetical protein